MLDGSSSKADALRVQVAAALFERVPAEPITSPDTETWCERVEALLRDLHEERPTQNALATFLLNGWVTVAGGPLLAGQKWRALLRLAPAWVICPPPCSRWVLWRACLP